MNGFGRRTCRRFGWSNERERDADPVAGAENEVLRLFDRAAVLRPAGADRVNVWVAQVERRGHERPARPGLAGEYAVEPHLRVRRDVDEEVGLRIEDLWRRRRGRVRWRQRQQVRGVAAVGVVMSAGQRRGEAERRAEA